MRNEVPGSRFAVSENGWVDHELFSFFLTEHFMTHAVSHRPLLDGHSTHFEPWSLEFSAKHDAIIFCLPPHTTHVCQPLDCSLFKPLKMQWRQECHKFYQKNPELVISKFNFCSVIRGAWLSTILPTNVIAGFRKSGTYPCNRDAVLNSVDNLSNSNKSTTGMLLSIKC